MEDEDSNNKYDKKKYKCTEEQRAQNGRAHPMPWWGDKTESGERHDPRRGGRGGYPEMNCNCTISISGGIIMVTWATEKHSGCGGAFKTFAYRCVAC